jgi:hypothetical protein
MLASGAALVALFAAPSAARAAEFQLRGGLVGEGSSWRDDGAGQGSLMMAVRFKDLVSVYGGVRVGAANVDQRMLTMVQLGGQIWGRLGRARPYFRFGLVHQHEESFAAVGGDVFGALFGVGDGIRHRGGFEWGAGLDVPFKKHKSWEFFGTVEGLVTWFPDPRGPAVYGGGGLGLGFNYSL